MHLTSCQRRVGSIWQRIIARSLGALGTGCFHASCHGEVPGLAAGRKTAQAEVGCCPVAEFLPTISPQQRRTPAKNIWPRQSGRTHGCHERHDAPMPYGWASGCARWLPPTQSCFDDERLCLIFPRNCHLTISTSHLFGSVLTIQSTRTIQSNLQRHQTTRQS